MTPPLFARASSPTPLRARNDERNSHESIAPPLEMDGRSRARDRGRGDSTGLDRTELDTNERTNDD